jgi:hypothetical protein
MNTLINKILEELKDENNQEKFNNNKFCRVKFDNLYHTHLFFFADEIRPFENLMMEEHKVTILLIAFSTLPYFKRETEQYKRFRRRIDNQIRMDEAIRDIYQKHPQNLGSVTITETATYKIDIPENIGEILSNTLTKHLTNSNWLEILNTTYLENVSL